MKITLGG